MRTQVAREGRAMKVGEVYWEVEAYVSGRWIRLPFADGESFRFDREADACKAIDEFRLAGREYRLVRVTREVIEPE
jgi:hypothetical protein